MDVFTNETIETMLQHRSVRNYLPKEIPPQLVDTLIRCGQMSASSSLVQAYTIIQVKDPAQRNVLFEVSGKQKWVLSAPLLLLFCCDQNRANKYYPGVDKQVLGFAEQLLIGVIDTALAAQNIALAAESSGLGLTFVGGIRNDTEEIIQAFQLPQFVYPLFAMCIGYPDEKNEQKPRLPMPVILKQDRYTEDEDPELIKEYDHTTRQYYFNRTSGTQNDSWCEHSAQLLLAKTRPNVGKSLRNQGFLQGDDLRS